MIRVGEDIPDTRRRMNPHELLAGSAARSDTEAALEAFADARLITKDNDTAQITHEALIRSWPRLRDWMNTDREDRLLAQEVETNSTEWQRDNRDADRLYRGNQLTRARTLDDGPRHGDLSDTAREFLRASIERERAEQQGLLRRTRRLRQLVAVLSCLVLIAATMAAIAVLSRNELAALHDESVSREVAGVAAALRGSDPDLAAQLALAAYQIADTAEARGALITALGNLDPERRSYSGSNDAVQAVAFSHDGQSLVAASRDKFARVWAVGNPPSLAAPPIAFLEHPGQVRSAVFDPTDRFLITSGSDGVIRIWPAADFGRNTEPIRPLPGPTGARGPLAFSPDGLILATGGPSGPTIRLWDVSDLTNPRMDVEFDAHQGEVGTVALSKDGRTLATGSDGTTKLWDITHRASPIELTKFDRHAGTAVAFSPDGHLLAIGNGDGSVMLVDVADPRQPREMPPFPAHQTGVAGVAFSPDSATLATASVDTTARLWNVSDPARPKLTATLDGDADNVYSVAFQPNGHTLATSSYGGTVRLWETDVKQAATEVCELAFPDITRTQWERYLPAGYEYKPPCLGPPGANRRRADVSTPPASTSLVAAHSHKCVAIKGQVTAPGTPASQITCIRAHGARTQGAQWFLQRTDSPRPGGVVYHIRNTATGMCLDSLPSERRVGGASEVVQRPCVAASLSQSWKFEVTSQRADLTDGRFVNIEYTECLNVNYAAVNDDAPIIRWQCGNDLNGIFQVSTGAR
jgi:WD40 repeat protein